MPNTDVTSVAPPEVTDAYNATLRRIRGNSQRQAAALTVLLSSTRSRGARRWANRTLVDTADAITYDLDRLGY